jgi:hypothetical protein
MSAKEHVCKDNEHTAKLAAQNDFFDWNTLWKANTALKRDNPNVLYKTKAGGDKVQIPEKKEKKENCDAGPPDNPPVHTFKVPTYKMWLRLRILKDDFSPIEDSPYELKVQGVDKPFKNKTKKELIEHEIPIDSTDAELILRVKAEATDKPKSGGDEAEPDKPKEPQPVRGEVPITWKLQIGKLNPIKEKAPDSRCISGVQQRLNNLALNSGPVDGKLGPNTRAAIKAFQDLYQIKLSKGDEGKPHRATQDKLYDVHDGPSPVPKPPEPKPAEGS